MWVFFCLGCDDRWMDATRHRDWFVIDQQVQGGWSRCMFNSLGSLQLQFGAFLTWASCLQRYTTHNLPWVWDGGSFSQLSERAFKRILLFMKFSPIVLDNFLCILATFCNICYCRNNCNIWRVILFDSKYWIDIYYVFWSAHLLLSVNSRWYAILRSSCSIVISQCGSNCKPFSHLAIKTQSFISHQFQFPAENNLF
jgi:hypothetical protein